jgi:hypothetical protein
MSQRKDVLRRILAGARSILRVVESKGAPTTQEHDERPQPSTPLPATSLVSPNPESLSRRLAEAGIPDISAQKIVTAFLRYSSQLQQQFESSLRLNLTRLNNSSSQALSPAYSALYTKQIQEWEDSAVASATARIAEHRAKDVACVQRQGPPVPYQKRKDALPPFNVVRRSYLSKFPC